MNADKLEDWILRNVERLVCAGSEVDLSHWSTLMLIIKGKPSILFHGTTATFKKFDIRYSRKELVNPYYGVGIFLTPDYDVADRYAHAARNSLLPKSVISDFSKVNPVGGRLMALLYNKGHRRGFDEFIDEYLDDDGSIFDEKMTRALKGVDPNDISDVSEYIEGSKNKPLGSNSDFVNIFNMQPSGIPETVLDLLDDMGVDGNKYRPKRYMVKTNLKNPLVTDNRNEARSAKNKNLGYDCVIYHGPGIVGGVPEVAVYDPRKLTIVNVKYV